MNRSVSARVVRGLGVLALALTLFGVGVAAGSRLVGHEQPASPRLAEMPVSVARQLLSESESLEEVLSLVAGQLSQVYEQLDFLRNAYHQVEDDDRAIAMQRALERVSDYAADHARSIGQQPVEVIPEGK